MGITEAFKPLFEQKVEGMDSLGKTWQECKQEIQEQFSEVVQDLQKGKVKSALKSVSKLPSAVQQLIYQRFGAITGVTSPRDIFHSNLEEGSVLAQARIEAMQSFLPGEIIAKFKPLLQGDGEAEVLSAAIGGIVGGEMTPPNTLLTLSSPWKTIKKQIQKEFEEMAIHFEKGESQNGMAQFLALPEPVQRAICKELAVLARVGYAQYSPTALFRGTKGVPEISDKERARAIRVFLRSNQWEEQLLEMDPLHGARMGVFQKWSPNCEEIRQFVHREPEGKAGKILKATSPILIHAFILQNLLKGQGKSDHHANTLIKKGSSKIEHLIACDDEYTQPFSADPSHYSSLRMRRIWALGLPQAEKPFSKALLMVMQGDTLGKRVEGVAKPIPDWRPGSPGAH